MYPTDKVKLFDNASWKTICLWVAIENIILRFRRCQSKETLVVRDALVWVAVIVAHDSAELKDWDTIEVFEVEEKVIFVRSKVKVIAFVLEVLLLLNHWGSEWIQLWHDDV